MYSEEQAKKKLLELVNNPEEPESDEFEVTSIYLSSRKDFWVMGVSCIDPEILYVGVSGYLLHVESGHIEVVGSAESPEHVLQDKYDLYDAGLQKYVLVCSHNPQDKKALMNIRQVFAIPISGALDLIRDQRQWFQGKKRSLMTIQALLKEQGIQTTIELTDSPQALYTLDRPLWFWEDLQALFASKMT